MLVVLARIERLARQAAAPASGESRGLTTVETLPDAPADNKCGPPSDVPIWQGFYHSAIMRSGLIGQFDLKSSTL